MAHAIGVFNGNWKHRWNRPEDEGPQIELTDEVLIRNLREVIEVQKSYLPNPLVQERIDSMQARLDALLTQQAQADADALAKLTAEWADQGEDYAEAFPDTLASGLDAAGYGSAGPQ